jgi:hypothetical protein
VWRDALLPQRNATQRIATQRNATQHGFRVTGDASLLLGPEASPAVRVRVTRRTGTGHPPYGYGSPAVRVRVTRRTGTGHPPYGYGSPAALVLCWRTSCAVRGTGTGSEAMTALGRNICCSRVGLGRDIFPPRASHQFGTGGPDTGARGGTEEASCAKEEPDTRGHALPGASHSRGSVPPTRLHCSLPRASHSVTKPDGPSPGPRPKTHCWTQFGNLPADFCISKTCTVMNEHWHSRGAAVNLFQASERSGEVLQACTSGVVRCRWCGTAIEARRG